MTRRWASMVGLVLILGHADAAPAATGDGETRAAIVSLHADLELGDELPVEILGTAVIGLCNLLDRGLITRSSPLVVIDYSRPSTDERLFVLDLETRRVVHRSLVAHGKGSGENHAVRFENREGSHASSLGFYRVGGTYQGRHGYSLKLEGLEPGLNDAAEDRAIVIHAADYVSREFIRRFGRLGRSWGCPALPSETARRIIDAMVAGCCLYIHGDTAELPGRRQLLDFDRTATCLADLAAGAQNKETRP